MCWYISGIIVALVLCWTPGIIWSFYVFGVIIIFVLIWIFFYHCYNMWCYYQILYYQYLFLVPHPKWNTSEGTLYHSRGEKLNVGDDSWNISCCNYVVIVNSKSPQGSTDIFHWHTDKIIGDWWGVIQKEITIVGDFMW